MPPVIAFTSLDPEHEKHMPGIKRRRPTRSWFLFISEGSNRPGKRWDHFYSLEFYAKDELWVVSYAETDLNAEKLGPRQVAAWCEAPKSSVVEIATALLLAWRDACVKFGGPGVEFYNNYGELKLPYEQFRMLCAPPWQSFDPFERAVFELLKEKKPREAC
jgi:hypothetical protein